MNEKRPLSLTLFFFRLLSGGAGGIAGTLMAFVVYFLMSSFVPAEGDSSLSVFAIVLIAFAASLTANLSVAAIVSFMDEEKYRRRKTILVHVLLFNIILFFLSIPLYMIGVALDSVSSIAAIHLLLSAFITSLVMEVLAGYQYALLGIYSAALGIFISISLALVMRGLNGGDLILTFGAMPAVWILLQLTTSLGEVIYDNFLGYYGLDALSTATDLGGDDRKEEPAEEEEETDENEDEGK